MKEFVAAIEEVEEPKDTLDFKINGKQLRAYRPTDGQFALLVLAMGRHSSEMNQVAGVVDFFFNVLDKDSQDWFMEGMSRRESMVPISTITDVLEWMVEEWSGDRPTKSSSVSTPSRRNGGRKSTQLTPAST